MTEMTAPLSCPYKSYGVPKNGLCPPSDQGNIDVSHPRLGISALERLLVEPHGGGESAAHAVRDVGQRVPHRAEHAERRQVPVVGPDRQMGRRLSRGGGGRTVVVLRAVLGAGGLRGRSWADPGGRGAGGLVGDGGILLGRLLGGRGGGQAQADGQKL